MNTSQLIETLSANVEPVNRRQLTRKLLGAVVLGGVATLLAAVLVLGVRPDLAAPSRLAFLLLKLTFTAGVVVIAAVFLLRLARPGGERRSYAALAVVPFAGVVVLAAFSLAEAPLSRWEPMIIGHTWLECLVSIPVIAVVPFALMMWVVHRLAAPTDLVRTGAFVGLVAGGVSAMAYALHCTDDSISFIALWYGGTIAFCGMTGAVLGPRLLRW